MSSKMDRLYEYTSNLLKLEFPAEQLAEPSVMQQLRENLRNPRPDGPPLPSIAQQLKNCVWARWIQLQFEQGETPGPLSNEEYRRWWTAFEPHLTRMIQNASREHMDGSSFAPENQSAIDLSAFRPAKEFIDERHPDHKAVRKVLKANPWIKTCRPRTEDGKEISNRLKIHSGHWKEYLAQQRQATADPLDLSPENVARAVREAEARKAAIDAERKQRG